MLSLLDVFAAGLLQDATSTTERIQIKIIDDGARSHRVLGVNKLTCNSCRESRWTASPSQASPCSARRKKSMSSYTDGICAASLGMKLLDTVNAKKPCHDRREKGRDKKLDFPILPRRSVDSDPEVPHDLPLAA